MRNYTKENHMEVAEVDSLVQGREEEARAVLARIRPPGSDVGGEVAEILKGGGAQEGVLKVGT